MCVVRCVQILGTLTRCDYEVPGMILLRDLKGAMLFNRSKDISVHV